MATPVTGTVTCATTTTLNSTYAGVSPSDHRNYNVDTSLGDVSGIVSGGAIVDGFGLAFTNTVGGANELLIVNDGTIQVSAGNLATAGGSAALSVTALGATNVDYGGTGNVINLGTGGDGISMTTTGTGSLVANVGGNVTSAVGGTGIFVIGGTGTTRITTTVGRTVRADFVGVWAAAGDGNVQIINNANVVGLAANGLDWGILGQSGGLGGVSIANGGAIGSAGDRIVSSGITGQVSSAANTAGLSITGTGPVFTTGTGIWAINAGTGLTNVNYTGAINTTTGDGILTLATSGDTTITTGAITTAGGGNAVSTSSTTGDQIITIGGAVTSAGAEVIDAVSTSGDITINVNGNVTRTGAVFDVIATDTAGISTVNVQAARTIGGAGAGDILNFYGTGAATLNNSGTIGTATSGLAIFAPGAGAVTVNNLAGGVINGNFLLGGFADTITNGGTISLRGASNFGAGADTFTNAAAGIITLTANSSLVGLETFTQNGRINLDYLHADRTGGRLQQRRTIDTAATPGWRASPPSATPARSTWRRER